MGTPYTPPGKDPTGNPHPQPVPPDPCEAELPSAADLDAVAEEQQAAEETE
jgi:hypothetical protein